MLSKAPSECDKMMRSGKRHVIPYLIDNCLVVYATRNMCYAMMLMTNIFLLLVYKPNFWLYMYDHHIISILNTQRNHSDCLQINPPNCYSNREGCSLVCILVNVISWYNITSRRAVHLQIIYYDDCMYCIHRQNKLSIFCAHKSLESSPISHSPSRKQ
jgi:hypothetical protein